MPYFTICNVASYAEVQVDDQNVNSAQESPSNRPPVPIPQEDSRHLPGQKDIDQHIYLITQKRSPKYLDIFY